MTNSLNIHYTGAMNRQSKSVKAVKIACLLLVGCVFSALAENPLEKINRAHQTATLLSADFVQEKKTRFISQPLISSGHFAFAPQRGLLWEIQQPFAAKTLFADDQVFLYDTQKGWGKSDDSLIDKAFADTFKRIIAGNWQAMDAHFDIKTTANTDSHWEVQLTPTATGIKSVLQHIVIQGAKTIAAVTVIDQRDNRTTISLSNWQKQQTPLDETQTAQFAHP